MHDFVVRAALAVALVCSLACGGSDDSDTRAECNPLGGPACLMPWPSSAYLVDDSSSPTGVRLELPAAALPVNIDGVQVEPEFFNRFDGFSVSGPMLVAFEGGVSSIGLPPHQDPGASMRADASVVVVNMDTRERLTIFAEPDMNADHPEERSLIIRPLERMVSGTRYAVGIRTSVKAADGSDLPISDAFERLLAGKSLTHPLGARIEAGYPEIFEALEDAGVPRDDLLLAWEFKTASDDFLLGDLMKMRERALPEIGEGATGLDFDVEVLSNQNPEQIRHFIAGTYDVPMFLTDGEEDGSVLARDGAGDPVITGTARAKYAAIVPRCVETAPLPRPLIVFGHGMFGNAKDSLDYEFLQDLAETECVIVVGGDWIGLTNRQFAAVAFAMNDINRGLSLTEKLHQGLINFVTLQRLARHRLADAPEFQFEGQAVVDTEEVYYFGASLGGILGTVFMALDPDIERAALGVPGGPWSLLFERSTYWPPLRITMMGAYNASPWDYQQNVALLGMMFDKIDPVTTASRVIDDPLPNTPPKQLLLYMAVGDALVSNVGSFALARSLGIPVTAPSVRSQYGVDEKTVPMLSAMTVYDESVDPDELPPESNHMEGLTYNDTHGDVNTLPAVRRQVLELFFGAQVMHHCKLEGALAPCLCTTGACE